MGYATAWRSAASPAFGKRSVDDKWSLVYVKSGKGMVSGGCRPEDRLSSADAQHETCSLR